MCNGHCLIPYSMPFALQLDFMHLRHHHNSSLCLRANFVSKTKNSLAKRRQTRIEEHHMPNATAEKIVFGDTLIDWLNCSNRFSLAPANWKPQRAKHKYKYYKQQIFIVSIFKYKPQDDVPNHRWAIATTSSSASPQHDLIDHFERIDNKRKLIKHFTWVYVWIYTYQHMIYVYIFSMWRRMTLLLNFTHNIFHI